MAGRSQRDMMDMAALQDGIALADRHDWLLSILALRMRQAIQRDQDIAGGGLRLLLLLGPGLTAIQAMRNDLVKLVKSCHKIQRLIQARALKVKEDE